MTLTEEQFHQNLIVGIFTCAITEARRSDRDGMNAREWLISEYAQRLADEVGLEPGYWLRIIPHSWLSRDGKQRHTRPSSQISEAEKVERQRIADERRRAKSLGLTRKQLAFVEAFHECQDVEQARHKVGSLKETVRKWLKNEKITKYMKGYQQSK